MSSIATVPEPCTRYAAGKSSGGGSGGAGGGPGGPQPGKLDATITAARRPAAPATPPARSLALPYRCAFMEPVFRVYTSHPGTPCTTPQRSRPGTRRPLPRGVTPPRRARTREPRQTKAPARDELVQGLSWNNSRRRPTLPRSCPRSTIGAEGLNCRVRNGNGCDPLAMATEKLGLVKDAGRLEDATSQLTGRDDGRVAVVHTSLKGAVWIESKAIEFASAQSTSKNNGQAERSISTGKLNASLRLHIPPIKLVVFQRPSGKSHLGRGFPLRCFQRLSRPCIATQRHSWRNDWYTRGMFTPVLSY